MFDKFGEWLKNLFANGKEKPSSKGHIDQSARFSSSPIRKKFDLKRRIDKKFNIKRTNITSTHPLNRPSFFKPRNQTRPRKCPMCGTEQGAKIIKTLYNKWKCSEQECQHEW